MKMELWIVYFVLVLMAVGLWYVWTLWTLWRAARLPDEAEERLRGKQRYQREVEKGYATDLEVPAFYRQRADQRRSRYIGRRAAVLDDLSRDAARDAVAASVYSRWHTTPVGTMPEGTTCYVCELAIATDVGRVARQRGLLWAHDRCVQP